MKLSVNLDHVATLRQARLGKHPQFLEACRIVAMSGAKGITFHLREDRRHIQDQDVRDLQNHFRDKTCLNFEAAFTSEMLGWIHQVEPQQVCFVPEKRQELTTEGGLFIPESARESFQKEIQLLQEKKIEVSLFVEAKEESLHMAKEVGADAVELHTGNFADAQTKEVRQKELDRLCSIAERAHDLGLVVNIGHGLLLEHMEEVSRIPHVSMVSIGHGLISLALFVGLDKAIQLFLEEIEKYKEIS